MAATVATSNASDFADDAFVNAPNIASVAASVGDLIIVAYNFRATDAAEITPVPTWNGESFSEIFDANLVEDAGVIRLQFFRLVAASAGTYSILASNSQYKAHAAGYAVISGANTSGPIDIANMQSENRFGTWSSPSLSVPSVGANDLVFEILAATDWDGGYSATGATWSRSSNQTELTEVQNTGNAAAPLLVMAHKTGSGSVPVAYAPSAGSPGYIHVAFRVIGASGGTTPVSADSDLRWSILQSLQNDLTAQWDIRAGVNADLDARWDVLQSINADSDLRWSVLQQIAQDLELRWNTDASLSTVQSDLTLQWSIIAAIAQSLQLDWSILQSVTQDADIRWSVLAAATQDLTARWDVLQAIQAGATLQWDVIGTAERALTLRWSIESDTQFPDITGEITIQTATPRITIAQATPRITIH